ncbi:hypothetical protein TrRE_jg10919 [Triparma retinervis]|uniref:Uncharacterized protein n=1 Tax=Triparma retinervis TaxID=2557542 RepID=A0A9W6ZQL7_9STRA|nr:hypothetical protein TrRE_jg10919 [Triparma retinervis]
MDLLNLMQGQGTDDQLQSARTELGAAKEQNALLKNKIHTLNSTVSTLTAEKTALQSEVAALREMLALDPPASASSTSSSLLSPLFPPSPPTTLTLSNNIPSPSKSNITAVASTPTCTYTAHSDRTVYSISHGLYDSKGGLLPTRSTTPVAYSLGNVSAPVVALEVVDRKVVAACLDGKVFLHDLDGDEGFEETNVVSACFSAPHLYVYADGVHVHRYTPSPTTNDLGPALLIPVNRGGDTHKSVRILRLEASPDGRYLAGQTDKGKIIIWNIGEGEGGGVTPTPVRELYGHQGDDFFLGLLLWDSESSRVISNSHDNSLYLYSCSTGEALQTITGDEGGGHRAKVRDMKRNGDTVTTAGWDGWVKIWVLM